jgi:hypothetical protein
VRLGEEEKHFLFVLKRMDEGGRRLWFSLGLTVAKARGGKR